MQYHRIVIKIGSSSLTCENGRLNLRQVDRLARTLSDLMNNGCEILLVSSGAISVGTAKLRLPNRPTDVPGKQAAAAVGQCELMYIYDKLFSEYGHTVAQVLLTRDVVTDEIRHQNAANTFERLLSLGVLPIVNENDTVATEELVDLVFGDNDTLSALVAQIVRADLLVLLSDIDGLYSADPHKDKTARKIDVVEKIDDSVRALAGGAGSAHGTGGMRTKVNAAEIAGSAGIDTVLASADDPTILFDLIENNAPVGTRFLAQK